MTQPSTCDLCDAHGGEPSLRVLPPVFQAYGGKGAFQGKVSTVQCFEDNSQVRAALDSAGEARVLVVDGGASLRCALVGGNLAALGVKNGWAGIVVNGCVRDRDEIAACAIGVRALGLHPMRSDKRGEGRRDVPVRIQGHMIRPGDWLVADADGILVFDRAP